MLDVIASAKNAIESYNAALKITSANIANMNVPGYKRLDVSFQSIFEKLVSQGTSAETDRGGTNPKQLGQGMGISGISVDFSSGELAGGALLDLAITGSGLFIVSPDGGTTYQYTRAGSFQIDAAGNLTSNGLVVYGLDGSGNLVPITALPSGNKSDYQWQADGTLQYTADGGATYTSTGYKIALTYFANPSGLGQTTGTALLETLASGAPAAAAAPGGAYGSINPGQIEQSNVFYLGESITALELQRAVSGNLSMVRLASDLISSFISKLG